jgi:hypothetical protein
MSMNSCCFWPWQAAQQPYGWSFVGKPEYVSEIRWGAQIDLAPHGQYSFRAFQAGKQKEQDLKKQPAWCR